MRNRHWIIIFLFAVASVPGLRAQDSDTKRDQLEEEKRIELKRMAEFDQGYAIDYGGWIRFDYSNTEGKQGDTNQKAGPGGSNLPGGEGEPTREAYLSDLRLWVQLKIGEAHKFYFRSVSQYKSVNHGDAFGEPGNSKSFDTKEFNLDQGYYQLKLRPLIQGEAGGRNDYDVDVTVGRQFFRVGRGIVYNKVHNGILLDTRYKMVSLDLLASRTPVSENDFDKSRPNENLFINGVTNQAKSNSGETNRQFFGAQFGWKAFPGHEFYAFGLVQRDKNSEEPRSPRDFDYNSEYWGIGARGSLTFLPGKERYFFEVINQTGRSVGRNDGAHPANTTTSPIRAWALDAGVEAFFDKVWSQPRANVEYIFAQGDQDRRSLSSSTAGNERGTTDTTFIGFGFLQTGYASAPRVSNIHIAKVGATFKPLTGVSKWFAEFETGPTLYWYWKDDTNGPVSDSRARHNSRFLGFETDWTIRWNILSDVAFSVNYGYFWPGAAYSSQSTSNNGMGGNASDRHSLSVSLTYSF
ncbi:MAG: alginate export family protein [Planctomycetes bacterium]|nr:alginate export family protein [Planctomycetota bacterium]